MYGMGQAQGLAGISSWRIFNLAGTAFPSKAANIRRTDEMFDLVFKACDKPYWQREVQPTAAEAFVENLPQRYIVLRMMLPALGKSIQSRDQIEVQAAGVRVMLALEIYRARNGRYPTKLEELAPLVVRTMPVDPFTGKAFGYRLLEPSEDPDHRRYTLYSFGADQTDNGGKTKPKDDFIALRPLTGRGFDYVINPARAKIEHSEEDETPAEQEQPK
jgi:hypothetical protein